MRDCGGGNKEGNLPAKNHVPFRQIEDLSVIRELIKEFRPHVLHSHWLHSAKLLGKACQAR